MNWTLFSINRRFAVIGLAFFCLCPKPLSAERLEPADTERFGVFTPPDSFPQHTPGRDSDDIDRRLNGLDALIASRQNAKALNILIDALTDRADSLIAASRRWVPTSHPDRRENDAFAANTVFVPAGRVATQRLKTLPPETLAAYRTIVEQRAAREISDAIRRLDVQTLRSLADRYPLTSAQADALYALGALALERRDARQAAFYWERLLRDCPQTTINRDAVRYRIIEAKATGGELAPEILDPAIAASVSIDGGRRSPLDYLNALAQNADRPSDPRSPTMDVSKDWSVRHLEILDPIPLDSLFSNSPQPSMPQKPVDDDSARALRFYDVIPAQTESGLPVIATDSGVAVFEDCRLTIRHLFRFPADNLNLPVYPFLYAHPVIPLAQNGDTVVLPVVPFFPAIRQLSGRRIPINDFGNGILHFALRQVRFGTELPTNDADFKPLPVMRQDQSVSRFQGIASGPIRLSSDRLAFVKAAQFDEDEWRWSLTVVRSGKRNALLETEFDIMICDGSLASASGANSHLPMLSLPPAVVTDADGATSVYVVPNQGCVARLDAMSGRLDWLSAYTAADRNVGDNLSGENLYYMPFPTAPFVIGDTLVAMPQDSPFVFGFDTSSGEMRWAFSRQWHILRFISPPADGSNEIILTGKSLVALDAKTGALLRSVDLPARAVGTGFIRNGVVYVPTQKELLAYRLTDFIPNRSESINWSKTSFTGGNAFPVGDSLLVMSSDTVLRGINSQSLVEKLKADADADPSSIQKRVEYADRLLALRRTADAAAEYKRAMALANEISNSDVRPNDVTQFIDVKSRMSSAYLQVVQSAPNEDAEELFREAAEFIFHPTVGIQCYRKLALSFAEQKNARGEMDAWRQVLAFCDPALPDSRFPYNENVEAMLEAEREANLSIRKLVSRYGIAAVYEVPERLASDAYGAAWDSKDADAAEAIALRYPGATAAPKALLFAGWLHRNNGRSFKAMAAYERFLDEYPGHTLDSYAREQLNAVYRAEGFDAAAERLALRKDEIAASPIFQRRLELPVEDMIETSIPVRSQSEFTAFRAQGNPPVIANNYIIAVASAQCEIHVIDPLTGAPVIRIVQTGTAALDRSVWLYDGSLALLTLDGRGDGKLGVYPVADALTKTPYPAEPIQFNESAALKLPNRPERLLSDGERLFVISRNDNRIDGYDSASSQPPKLIWTRQFSPDNPISPYVLPMVFRDEIIVVSSIYQAVFLDIKTGAIRRTITDRLPTSINGAAVNRSGRLLLIGNLPGTTPTPSDREDYASCYDTATGKFLWAIKADDSSDGSSIPRLPIKAAGDGFLIGGFYLAEKGIFLNEVYLIDGRDGSLVWRLPIRAGDQYIIDENILYFSGIEAYRLSDGVKLWDARSAEEFKQLSSHRFMRDHIVFNQSLFSDANVTLNAVSAIRRDNGATDWSHFQLTEHRNQMSSISSDGTPQSLSDIVCHRWGITLLGWKSELTTTTVQLANGRVRSSMTNLQKLTIRTALTNPDAIREDLARLASTLPEPDAQKIKDSIDTTVQCLSDGRLFDASLAIAALLDVHWATMNSDIRDRLIVIHNRLRRRARAASPVEIDIPFFTDTDANARAAQALSIASDARLSLFGVKDLWLLAPGDMTEYNGETDCRADIRFAATNDSLYGSVAVTDDRHINDAGSADTLHQGDSVILYIDADNDGGLFPDSGDFEIHAGLSSQIQTKYNVFFSPSLKRGFTKDEIHVEIRRDADRTTYSFKIDWSVLDGMAADGSRVRASVVINDIDVPDGRAVQLSPYGNHLDFRAPEYFPVIKLEERK